MHIYLVMMHDYDYWDGKTGITKITTDVYKPLSAHSSEEGAWRVVTDTKSTFSTVLRAIDLSTGAVFFNSSYLDVETYPDLESIMADGGHPVYELRIRRMLVFE